MPELPEVQTIVSDLQSHLIGAHFLTIEASHLKAVISTPKDLFRLQAKGVESIQRRGKFIVIVLKGDGVIVIHLRMSGKTLIRQKSDPIEPHERARLEFDRLSLRFCDQRKFGRVWLSNLADYQALTGIARLGIEPLSTDFTPKTFANLLRGKKKTIKACLLDQALIAGIGNIYADEACFEARIRPNRLAASLSPKEYKNLHMAIQNVLWLSIQSRGTSRPDGNYRDAHGKRGNFQNLLKVYRRHNQPCFHCKTLLIRTKVAGRGTVHCVECQRKN